MQRTIGGRGLCSLDRILEPGDPRAPGDRVEQADVTGNTDRHSDSLNLS